MGIHSSWKTIVCGIKKTQLKCLNNQILKREHSQEVIKTASRPLAPSTFQYVKCVYLSDV